MKQPIRYLRKCASTETATEQSKRKIHQL